MLFCEMNPLFYAISVRKEILKRNIGDLFGEAVFAKEKSADLLPVTVSEKSVNMIKRLPGVDIATQEGKAVNIALAAEKINGLVIHPGETFSFWKTVGNTTAAKGYRVGRIIEKNKLVTGIGGGLCNLGNVINLLVLQSPLKITEFHMHSDALSPDEGKREPLSSGTSVCYNYIDYRFENDSDRDVQLVAYCESEVLHAELRSEREFSCSYELAEENHRFTEENGKFYRCSEIYRVAHGADGTDKKKLIVKNHSEVMYNYALIPRELVR